jgi:UDP-N-acetylglucosamine--N-acetylmuramyl-(pentapeptide) pyrophosphoryl-undecaprenol N-acetylglucosamine transferase
VYPALAVLQAATDMVEETLWVGGKGGIEAGLVSRANIPYTQISAAGVHGVGLRALPGNLVKLARGYFEAVKILRSFQPDVIFFTGGYVAVPMALAGRKVKTLLYVPDIEPGMALKVLSRFADMIALTDEKSSQYFKGKEDLAVTGYPVRNDLIPMTRADALKALGFSDNLPVILVMGGSKGAHSINQVVFDNLETILEKAQLVHLTGALEHQAAIEQKQLLQPVLAQRYQVHSYMHDELSAAFSAASLAVCRSGASTLGELPLFGLPAILVPYPYAWRYQKVNADHLVEKGGAVVVENAQLPAQLIPTLNTLLGDENRLAEMSRRMKALAIPHAADRIADLLLNLSRDAESGRK